MKLIPILTLLLTVFVTSCGNIKVSESNEIIDYPDVEAQYPGGAKAMKKFLANNIRYPEVSMDRGDQGKVFAQFVIEKNGTLTNIEVLKGVTKEIDAETIRVISTMPKWTPAIYNRKYVRARARLPINFVLE